MPTKVSKVARKTSGTRARPVTSVARENGVISNKRAAAAPRILGSHAAAFLVAVISLLCVWLTVGRWLRISFDEGIYLVGAQCVAAGLAPYKDFFAITGPGTFWIYGTLFKIIGLSYIGAHLLLAFEVSVITSAMFLLVSWAARSRIAGALASAFYLAITIFNQMHLLVNHRWDSLCLMALGTALLAHTAGTIDASSRTWQRLRVGTCGMLAAGACCSTPTVFLAVLGAIVWLRMKRRDLILPYAGGFAIIGLLAVAALAKSSALQSAVAMFAWNQQHYAHANAVWFGWFHVDSSVWTHNFTLIAISLGIALLPPIFPLVTTGLWAYTKWKIHASMPGAGQLSLITGICMLAASYPRVASNQLLFATPFFFAPFAFSIVRAANTRWRTGVGILAGAVTIVIFMNIHIPHLENVRTGMGVVRCTRADARVFDELQEDAPPGSIALAYPYLPILYSITGTRPPGYYSFLQPGMMGRTDDARMLADANKRPPAVVFRQHLTPERILELWPNSDRGNLTFPGIERFIVENYSKQETAKLPVDVWLAKNSRR